MTSHDLTLRWLCLGCWRLSSSTHISSDPPAGSMTSRHSVVFDSMAPFVEKKRLKKHGKVLMLNAGFVKLVAFHGFRCFPSQSSLAIFSPGIWKAWMRFFLEDGGMHWKRLCLDLWHHVGSWYLDVMEGGYFTIVFIGFLGLGWHPSSLIWSMRLFWMISYPLIHCACVCVHVSWYVHLSLWSSTLRKMRWKQVLPTQKIKHPTMTLSPH